MTTSEFQIERTMRDARGVERPLPHVLETRMVIGYWASV